MPSARAERIIQISDDGINGVGKRGNARRKNIIEPHVFDTKKKFQVNYEKKNPFDVMIQESKTKEEKQIIEQKENTFDQQHLTDIEKKWLI